MFTRHSAWGRLLFLGLSLVLVCGCPKVPFDASGTYHGYWKGSPLEAWGVDDEVECPLTISLTQQAGWPLPFAKTVLGVVSFDYTCFLPDELAQYIDLNSLEVPVWGQFETDGTFTLNEGICIDPNALCVVLKLEGKGRELNGDGFMDTANGTMKFRLAIEGTKPLEFTASFTVNTNL